MPIHIPPISRRRFLAGSLAAGAGILLSRTAGAAERKADPNRWILVSDTHIGSKEDDTRHGIKPAEMFAETARQIVALDPLPAGVIISGDLAFLTGEAANYSLLRRLFQPLCEAGIPLHLVLGNHDHREHFWTAFPESKPAAPAADRHAAVVETKLANWFLLDSLLKTNHTPGQLGKTQLDWLAKTLDGRRDKPALIVAHHNLDGMSGLLDSAALLETVSARKQAKAYFYGHTHQWKVKQNEEIHLVNVPATAWLFDAKEPRGWLDVKLADRGADVTLHALDQKHAKHGECLKLKWRA